MFDKTVFLTAGLPDTRSESDGQMYVVIAVVVSWEKKKEVLHESSVKRSRNLAEKSNSRTRHVLRKMEKD